MRKLLAGIGTVIVSMTMMSHAQSPLIPFSNDETATRWFVELSSPPSADGTSAATLDREASDFQAAAAAAGVRYSGTRRFSELWNGVTISATAREVSKLRALPGVQGVYPDVKVSLAQQEEQPGNVADLVTALAQTGADIAQSELGLSGRGVHVAVIDTGVDFDHPDLGGCFGPGCRVEKGFDLVGDDFDNDLVTTPTPDPIPDDCNGHGTHVAGIIGANGGLKGVAPGVTFHAYRVFGCEGSTTSEIMIDAMERARRGGADVVNMSIGAAFQWPQYPTAKAADNLVRHGVVVVASAGNDGAAGLYSLSAPSVGKNVISVASFNNTHANLNAFSISPDDTKIGYLEALGAPAPPKSGSFPLARTGTQTSAADACAPLPAGSLSGRVALIRRGTCGFYVKSLNAQNAGAAGVVLYNNQAGFLSPNVSPIAPATAPITIPVVAITQARGNFVDTRLASGAVTLTWTNTIGSEPNPTANLISAFSSYGAAPDLSFKPDIGAPGGLVRSTLPLEQGGYGVLSGTSMSSPHVAGAVALMLEARPHADPKEVERRLQNSARPHLWFGNPALGFLDNVHRQGAGMLQINDAVLADAIVSPSSLAIGEIESGSVTKTLRISLEDRERHGRGKHGDDDPPVTYTLGHQSALATGPDTFTPAFFASFATVTFDTPSVTLDDRHHGHGDDDDAAIKVTITPPAAPTSARLFGGYITLTPSDGGTVLRVPYTGYNGDYQAIRVFTLAGFPALAKLTPTGFMLQPTGATFTMVGDDVPFVLVHLNHQVANFRAEVFDATTGKSLNFAVDEDFVGRNRTATGAFVVAWDGTTFKKQGGKTRVVPNGTYRIELAVLKALGDPRNPAHFERSTLPNITIARP